MNQGLCVGLQAGIAVDQEAGDRAQSQPQQNRPVRAVVARAHIGATATAGPITPRTRAFRSFMGIGFGST